MGVGLNGWAWWVGLNGWSLTGGAIHNTNLGDGQTNVWTLAVSHCVLVKCL